MQSKSRCSPESHRAGVAALFISALLAASASSQDVPYGGGCEDSFGVVPEISASVYPVTGLPFAIEGRARPNSLGLLFAGVSNQAWAGAPLPIQLFPFGFPGCALNTSIDVTAGFPTDATGVAFFPAFAWKAGVTIYFQAFILDISDPLNTGGWSRGLAVTPHTAVSPNLLLNPGAETGDTTAWTSGFSAFMASQFVAFEGSHSFATSVLPSATISQKQQVIDLFSSGIPPAVAALHTSIHYRTRVLPTCTICSPFTGLLTVRLLDTNGQLLIEKSKTLTFSGGEVLFNNAWNDFSITLQPGSGYFASSVRFVEVTESIAPGLGNGAFIDESEVSVTF